MKNGVLKAQFPANIQSLHQVIQWVREKAEKYSFSKKELFHIELATEEAVVNIIRHGYRKKEGKIQIRIESCEVFQIEIQDEAPAFNPLECACVKDPSQMGGIGIPLLLKCMDEVSYERKGSCNLLILKKKF